MSRVPWAQCWKNTDLEHWNMCVNRCPEQVFHDLKHFLPLQVSRPKTPCLDYFFPSHELKVNIACRASLNACACAFRLPEWSDRDLFGLRRLTDIFGFLVQWNDNLSKFEQCFNLVSWRWYCMSGFAVSSLDCTSAVNYNTRLFYSLKTRFSGVNVKAFSRFQEGSQL